MLTNNEKLKCHSGIERWNYCSTTLFQGVKLDWNVKFLVLFPFPLNVKLTQSSYACYHSSEYNTYLADCYAVDFLVETENLNNLTTYTFQDQYLSLKKQVNASNVCQYGTKSIADEPLSLFMSGLKQKEYHLGLIMEKPSLPKDNVKMSSRLIKEHYLMQMIQKTNKLSFKQQLAEHKKQQLKANIVFGALSHAFNLHLVRDKIAQVKKSDHCFSKTINPTCNKAAVISMEKHCGKFNEANIEYASYLRDACSVASAEEIDAKLKNICSITSL